MDNPTQITAYDGLSGAALFSAPIDFYQGMPRSGPADHHVAYWRTRVHWLSTRDQWIACLREYGAWDDFETAEDSTLMDRVLWVEGINTREQHDEEGSWPDSL